MTGERTLPTDILGELKRGLIDGRTADNDVKYTYETTIFGISELETKVLLQRLKTSSLNCRLAIYREKTKINTVDQARYMTTNLCRIANCEVVQFHIYPNVFGVRKGYQKTLFNHQIHYREAG